MAELTGSTPDIAEENIAMLREIFPDVFEEGKVDFDKLKQVLGDYVDDNEERYNFTWNGKGRALRLAQSPSTGTLRPCPEESKDWGTTQNLYIEGDNLEVLKLLQKSYHGKVKMIYIDPPYNTGGDFVYPDDYSDSMANYLRITGQKGEDGAKITTNTEASGRYHTDWLNMMYPRLRLARNLLADDGIIFISIDDNEIKDLIILCDEVFGEDNFIDNIIWKKRYGGGAKEKYLVSLHEYVLVYCKNVNLLDEIFVPLSQASIDKYYIKKDDKYATRGGYRTHPLEAGKAMDSRENLIYPIPAPDGTQILPKKQWLWSKERAYAALENNELEIIKGNDDEWIVSTKQYLKDDDGEVRQGKCFSIIDDVYTQHGTNEMISIFQNAKVFQYPKPSEFIKKLIRIASNGNDVILDFFSGSSSTAHAIFKQNLDDNRSRRFIMVQLPETCDNKSEAFKAGYKNICEIGKERIRRAGDKIKAKAGLLAQNLDIGFKVFKLDTSNVKKWNAETAFEMTEEKQLKFSAEKFEGILQNSVSNFIAGRTETDVVYEIMIKLGLDLTYPVEKIVIAGKTVYSIREGELMICLADDISNAVADGMVKHYQEKKPGTWKVVFKDNGFADDSAKTNVREILKCAGLDEDALTTL